MTALPMGNPALVSSRARDSLFSNELCDVMERRLASSVRYRKVTQRQTIPTMSRVYIELHLSFDLAKLAAILDTVLGASRIGRALPGPRT